MALNKIGTIITACERFGVPTAGIPERFHDVPVYRNPRLRTVLGKARRKRETGELSIEVHKCVFANPDQMKSTLAHEVAHIIAGIGTGHNRKWKLIAKSLGHSGERCASVETCERIGMPKRRRHAVRIVARCAKCEFELIRARAMPINKIWGHIGCGGRFERVD